MKQTKITNKKEPKQDRRNTKSRESLKNIYHQYLQGLQGETISMKAKQDTIKQGGGYLGG